MSLRISAKNLGHLAMPDACPRCFWIQTHCKLPYQIFPGIFSSIDSYSKKITNLHHAVHNRIPAWFDSLGDLGKPLPAPHWSRFSMLDQATGVTLTGVPDELLKAADGTVTILDYKTARFTGHQDSLLPIYQAQLNGYGRIAESLGMGQVRRLALIYYEPVTDITVDDVGSALCGDGFTMRFRANILPVERDDALVPSLLARAKAIHELPEPPVGREGCRDCGLLDAIISYDTRLIQQQPSHGGPE
jgi:hypothetical protein